MLEPHPTKSHGRPIDLEVPKGVYGPSAFTQLLIDYMPPLDGLHVLDAGCGSGPVSIAALRAGAARVCAADQDQLALDATRANVRLNGEDDAKLATFLVKGFDDDALRMCTASVVVANPPQAPAAVWRSLPPPEQPFHNAAGDDGMEALEALLATTLASSVITTLSALTLAAPLGWALDRGWRVHLLGQRMVAHHEGWRNVGRGDGDEALARVWRFERYAPTSVEESE